MKNIFDAVYKTERKSGKCRVCGCTEANPCIDLENAEACSWIDFDHTLCSNLRCIALTPLDDLLEMTIFRFSDHAHLTTFGY